MKKDPGLLPEVFVDRWSPASAAYVDGSYRRVPGREARAVELGLRARNVRSHETGAPKNTQAVTYEPARHVEALQSETRPSRSLEVGVIAERTMSAALAIDPRRWRRLPGARDVHEDAVPLQPASVCHGGS
jgi:hypothetical protein